MSGHSKWATIKRKKGANDAKRGALFTKLGKNIVVAARSGKDPETNSSLRMAIDKAKQANMPKDNIEKAILKGAGELPGVVYEEIMYEGYGPGGIALVIECVTDNTNRTVAFVRSTLTRGGGSLGNAGSVTYMFDQKGVIRIATDDLGPGKQDEVELLAIDVGADDIQTEAEGLTIFVPREQLNELVQQLDTSGVVISDSGIEWISQISITPPPEDVAKLEALIELLDENDDVNAVYTNADF